MRLPFKKQPIAAGLHGLRGQSAAPTPLWEERSDGACFFGVRGHVRALRLSGMSPSPKAATCCRTPKFNVVLSPCRPNEQAICLQRPELLLAANGIDPNLNQEATMKIILQNEQETVQAGLDVLTKHLPPSKVARLLSIWRVGHGDYTSERRELFTGETVSSLFAKARTHEKRHRKL